LIEVHFSETIRASDGLTVSTAVYAPLGTTPSKDQLGLIERAARAAAFELRGWEVEGFNFGIPPFVVRVSRGRRESGSPVAARSHLGFWDTREIRRRESSVELFARLALHSRAIQRLLEEKLRPGESVDAEGKIPTSTFLARVFWTPGVFRNRLPPVPVAEMPELKAEIERRLREARYLK
jgi:hypothetical protein